MSGSSAGGERPEAGTSAVSETRSRRRAVDRRATVGLRTDALRFLHGFGVVAAVWSSVLAATAPDGASRGLLAVGVACLWLWAVAAPFVPILVWWFGWLLVSVGLQVLGPFAGTGAWTVSGGAPFVPIAAAALTARRWPVVVTVAVLSAAALARTAINPAYPLSSSVGTVLIFAFGGLALWWFVRILLGGETERAHLRTAVAEADKQAALAQERAEAAARLHDSVLQSLTAIGRAEDLDSARRLAQDASGRLRSWLRTRSLGGHTQLRHVLEESCLAAAEGRGVTISGAGDRPVDERVHLLVEAVAEAVRNAARHTDGPIRVYSETGPQGTTVWVADQGSGFDVERIPPDRLGVRESIVGRLERAGGRAELRSEPEGSEWALHLPA